ncbi:hypothetical protein LguiB_013362 [Lonicera macranthoides]
MPPIPKDFGERRLMYYRVSNNHLHIVEIYRPHTIIFNVYEMEKDYSGWFVKYRVDFDALMKAFPESIRFISGFAYPGKAIVYCFKNRSFRKLCDFPPGENDIECDGSESSTDIECASSESSLKFNGWFDAFEFVESLFCA